MRNIMKRLSCIIIVCFISIVCFAQTKCSNCDGTGGVVCGYCRGNGVIVSTVWNPYVGSYQNVQTVCGACQGYRKVVCASCAGKGWIQSPSFKSKQAYYAECAHCKCKLYIPFSAANSYCATCHTYKCKSTFTSHYKRYR